MFDNGDNAAFSGQRAVTLDDITANELVVAGGSLQLTNSVNAFAMNFLYLNNNPSALRFVVGGSVLK